MRALLSCLLLFASYAQAAALVGPDDPNIVYTGRWDHSDVSAPWVYWKGSSVIARFEGTSISARVSAGNTDYLRIIIDGDAASSWKIPVSSGVTGVELISGLDDGIHQVEIVKETDVGRWTFRGFELDDGKSLLTPRTRPARRIVFYGDSNLAGYSLESERNESSQSLRGSYYGYAGIASRMFDAEYHNVSRSGATIRSLHNAFDRLDWWSRNPTWDFSRFVADLVVVNVGANDVGRPERRIKENYHAFLDDLRMAHPDAHIMLYNAWGWDYAEPANYIHEVIAERGDPDMSSAVFPWLFEQWHGCEYDHAGMARILADHVSAVLGWTPGASDVMSGYGVNGDVANGGFEEVAPFGGYGWRYYTDTGVSRRHDPNGAYSGDYYLRLADGAASHQPNPARPGDTVTASIWMRGAAGGEQVYVTVDFRDQEMWTTPLAVHTDSRILTATWQEYTISAVAPIGTARPVFHTRLTFEAAQGDTVDIDGVSMSVTGGTADTTPPQPDPMTWDSVPAATSETSISMTATTASDPSGVEYYFDCVSAGCSDSGWQDGSTYNETGLLPGTAYSYRAQARDKSANQNQTAFSSTETAATPDTCSATSSRVTSIVVSKAAAGQGWKHGRAVVTIGDDCGDTVAGAIVFGTFSGSYAESGSQTTDPSGIAVFRTSVPMKGRIGFTFCVDDVDATPPYDASANAETCDSL